MRTIKFRAWDKRFKQMVDSKCCVIADGKIVVNKQHSYNEFPNPLSLMNSNKFQPSEDLILMQFTGLKDKNNKEIYEGDIVKHTFRAWNDSGSCGQAYYVNTGEVYYKEKYASFQITRGGGGSPEFSLCVIDEMPDGLDPETNEVIGNIYENPELLEDK